MSRLISSGRNHSRGHRSIYYLLFVFLVFSPGCSSTDKPKGSTFASVIISGNTPGQIRDAAVVVFTDNGYKVVNSSPDRLVFEKQGSGMSNFAYGSWLGDDPVWVRVKAAVVPIREMTFQLQCSVFMVRDRGGSTEEEIALSRIHKHSYQKLLDEVAQRFAYK